MAVPVFVRAPPRWDCGCGKTAQRRARRGLPERELKMQQSTSQEQSSFFLLGGVTLARWGRRVVCAADPVGSFVSIVHRGQVGLCVARSRGTTQISLHSRGGATRRFLEIGDRQGCLVCLAGIFTVCAKVGSTIHRVLGLGFALSATRCPVLSWPVRVKKGAWGDRAGRERTFFFSRGDPHGGVRASVPPTRKVLPLPPLGPPTAPDKSPVGAGGQDKATAPAPKQTQAGGVVGQEGEGQGCVEGAASRKGGVQVGGGGVRSG